MGEELSFDNILGADQIKSLFEDAPNEEIQLVTTTTEQPTEPKDDKENKQDLETTEGTNYSMEELFGPESVGSERDNKEGEGTKSDKVGTSPNFYSSIAKALKEEGIFPDLDDEVIDKTSDDVGFRDLIDLQIKAGLDETQKRINDALNAGLEPDEIRQYEAVISNLNAISDEAISEEGDKGETLRKQLIYQDFINRGYSKERAQREVQKSLNAGSDIEDAKEALKSNKEFFQGQYDNLIKEGQEQAKQEAENRKKESEALKKSILEDKKVFGEIEVDKATRQKVYDNITKPIYKDKDGNLYNALLKYQLENRLDYIKNVGLLFTLTDGFKNLDKLVKDKVKKEVKNGLKNLESTINSTSRNSDGSLNFVTGVRDTDSYDSINWNKLDI